MGLTHESALVVGRDRCDRRARGRRRHEASSSGALDDGTGAGAGAGTRDGAREGRTTARMGRARGISSRMSWAPSSVETR